MVPIVPDAGKSGKPTLNALTGELDNKSEVNTMAVIPNEISTR
jgi:hypothetical protein